MLIKRTPDAYEKLQILGGMAGDDILSQATRSGREHRMPYSEPRNNPGPGVYRAAMPNGRYINLMRVMFTDFCMMDCAYCPNSHWVPRRRHAFKVDELARVFMELQGRLSVNIETPTPEMMRQLSTMKDLERDILAPMKWIHELTRSHNDGAVG